VTADAAPVEVEPTGLGSVPRRIYVNFRSGNLGPAPVLLALVVIVAYFSQTADNFFSATNFNNIITQMAGTTLLAFGVVFVLLLGEIDLSVAYVSGLCAVVAAEAQLPDGAALPGLVAMGLAVLTGVAIGAFQGSFVALIGVPSFVVTLAGFLMWQGMIIERVEDRGAIIIQDTWINNTANYFFSHRSGWILAVILSAVYVIALLSAFYANLRHGIKPRDPLIFGIRLVLPPLLILLVVYICNQDERRGVPLALLIVLVALFVLTYLAKRTTFGRHVYAVGGNAEAARRAGNALFGALVIKTIENGLNTKGYSQGIIFIVTGAILLFAVTLDAIARRLQVKSGR
jgi:D-xylose transport system permease protein